MSIELLTAKTLIVKGTVPLLICKTSITILHALNSGNTSGIYRNLKSSPSAGTTRVNAWQRMCNIKVDYKIHIWIDKRSLKHMEYK